MMPANLFARKPGSMWPVKTLAEQVREFMERQGLSATAMGKLCGVSRQNVQNVASGAVTSPHWIAALAKAMHTTTDALLTGAPTPPKLIHRATPWPFEFLTRDAWASLSAAERAVVDHAAAKAAAEFRRPEAADSKRQNGA